MKNNSIATENAAPTKTTVQHVIEASPSHAELRAEEQRARTLSGQRAEVKLEIDRLVTELNRTANPGVMAEDLLSGKGGIGSKETEAALQSAHDRIAVIDQALVLLGRRIATVRRALSCEVNARLKSSRQGLVTRIAGALHVLRAACSEDEALRAELAREGVDIAVIDNLVFVPVSADCGYELGWFEARRKQGFAV